MKKTGASLFCWVLLAQSARAGDFVSGANAWIEGRLAASSMTVTALLFLFLGGLFASLLPCVYPLYPVTATVLRNRAGANSRKWVHPLAYYFGLAAIYFLFGIIAAVSGGAFNHVLRLPETNLALSFLFLLLAMTTAGFLHLEFLQSNGAGGGQAGVLGTFLMGMGAGLLSSSCVGPFVVSILVKLAGTSEAVSAVRVFAAAGKMLAFGLGLGLPFLFIALFGVRLPKAGRWMRWVQYALGLLILWFSFVYLEKGFSSLEFSPEKIRLIFLGSLLLLGAMYRLQNAETDPFTRTARALAGLVLVVGFCCVERGLAPAAVAPFVAQATETNIEKKGNLSWYRDIGDALKAAAKQGRPVFVDFSAHWCANCKEFDKLTQSNASLNGALSRAVLCKIQDTDPDFKKFQADPRFPELKVGLPFLVVMDTKGNLLYKTSDFTRVEDMVMFLE
ncbi:MAG: cytochrome c biogenesis protein CcdA [Verrucomicrobiota bacterium]